MMKVLALFLGLASTVNALQLTSDNWEAETARKTVFLKFFAPWCGHCKKMAPDWDRMMVEYARSATQLVAYVDCTTEGKPLCNAHGVLGFPPLKWGDASDLQDYQGGREYAAFKDFAEENLKPMCNPNNIDLCDDDKKAEISKYQGISAADLDTAIPAEMTKL